MNRIALGLIFVSLPLSALGDEPPTPNKYEKEGGQAFVRALQAQREDAFNREAQMEAVNAQLRAQVSDLMNQIREASHQAKPATPVPSPTPTKPD